MGFARTFLPLFGALMVTTSAFGYGAAGHQMVGAIADQKLAGTPTQAKVKALLDGMPLETAANIPDEIKGWDKNGPDDPRIFHYTSRPKIDEQLVAFWKANQPTHDDKAGHPSHHWFHYTDVPLFGAPKYADGKVGRGDYDIVHMISYCVNVLQGTTPEDNERKITKAVAIILLSHFLGDIHQPLHVGAEYFDAAGNPVNPDKTPGALEDQGGNTIMLHLPQSLILAHRRGLKLHGFWDTDAVVANLPTLPDDMPKEEKRTKTDEAEAALEKEMVAQEPKDWREPADLPLTGYSEAWANEILPIAREAHERLAYSNVKPRKQQGDAEPLAAGDADGKQATDGVSYQDWAAKIVRMEIHKAGWRLADLLEKSLASTAVPVPGASPAADSGASNSSTPSVSATATPVPGAVATPSNSSKQPVILMPAIPPMPAPKR